MTAEHDALRDLIAPVALGAADPREVARVEAHAAECAVCREELLALRQAADVLAVAVPQREAPPALKASIMAVVNAEAPARAAAAGVEPRRAEAAAPRRRWTSWLGVRPWPAVAVTIVTVAALLLGWNIALQTSDSSGPDVAALAISGTADAPGITGRVVYVPTEGTAVMSLDRLPKLDAGEAYQLWVLRDGTARSAGLFVTTGNGEARASATNLAGADGLAVTAQPATNQVTPEGPILVQAPLQS